MFNYRLITIGGDGGLAAGKRGAFYNTLEEYQKYWERIDVICPPVRDKNTLRAFATSNGVSPLNYFGNVYLHCSPWPKFFQPWFIAKQLRQLVKTQGADLIVVQEYPPFYNSLGLWLAHIKAVPVSYEILHLVGYPRAGDWRERFYHWLNRLILPHLLRRADLVRVMNREVEQWLMERGVPAGKIKLLPAFYLDHAVFCPRPLEKKYDLVFCARLTRNKGIHLLLAAMELLKKRRPDIKLLVIGDGPEQRSAKRKVKNARMDANIIFNGWASNAVAVAELFNQSKVFIMPSYNEGGPRTMIEAMACGLPVVATRVGLVGELIREGENGFIADWRPTDIAAKAEHLLADDSLRQRFGLAGMAISRQFNRAKLVANYASAFHALIRQKQ